MHTHTVQKSNNCNLLSFVSRAGTSRAAWLIITLTILTGCATHVQNMPARTANQPPTTAFSNFKRFQMAPVSLNPAYADGSANQRAHKKIQEHLNANLSGMLTTWNASGSNAPYGTLLIEPKIVELKFVSGGARFMAGAMAGSSIVVMHVDYRDQSSGNIISHAEFYQRANAMGGSMSVGATDNDMLARIARLVSDFTRNNYSQPIGGPTGTVAQ